jgi:protocatechuate 3,4-dioxygenase alpha subunit
MTELDTTPSQTVGPYLSIGLLWPDGPEVVAQGTPEAITITGRLLDGAGEQVSDGMLEIWQADPDGRFDHPDDPRGPASTPGFRGFGRSCTDTEGRYWFRTLKPGPLPTDSEAVEAPHINVSVFARGLLHRVVTRIYFADEVEANAADPMLSSLPPADRPLLTAVPQSDGTLSFDIRLQGDRETPFFAV